METYSTIQDLLLRRYVTDFIGRTQQLSAPIFSRLRENNNFRPSGAGVYFAVEIQGNESGGGWRARDDNSLPASTNEQVKQATVLPKKYYHVVTFSGLMEAVSANGGEDAFASGVTYAISQAVRRAGANFEFNFLLSNGYGKMADIVTAGGTTTPTVSNARPFRPGQVVVILNNSTGALVDGPVTVTARNNSTNVITVSAAVTAATTDGIYNVGEQNEISLVETQALGLPALVNNTGTLYGIDRAVYTTTQAKVIDASSNNLDEGLLRRLRRQILIETPTESLDGFGYLTSYDQFDRYVEIALPFRRFNDMRLDLGADVAMTTHDGRSFLLSWLADPTKLYMLNLAAIERGVVRPLSIDERVNMVWIPGQDAFTVLMKYYGETIGRYMNQCGVITNLSVPTY